MTNQDNNIVTVTFQKMYDKYQWYVSCGNWQMRGYGTDLKDAEKHAYDTIRGIPNHGTVHTIYTDGKPVIPVRS